MRLATNRLGDSDGRRGTTVMILGTWPIPLVFILAIKLRIDSLPPLLVEKNLISSPTFLLFNSRFWA
jgi:hypothetical protein